MIEQVHSIAAPRVERGAGRENRLESTFGPGLNQFQLPWSSFTCKQADILILTLMYISQ